MTVLCWDKPKRARPSADHAAEYSSDCGAPGTYQPNMSDDDRAKWKARIVGAKTPVPQVEIRKDSAVIVISARGYKYNGYDQWARK